MHLDLAGLGSIDGEVDYVSSNFVGLRTADALVRFHGRGPLDLPVAVSHHAYGVDLDAAGAAQAWQAWLGDVFADA